LNVELVRKKKGRETQKKYAKTKTAKRGGAQKGRESCKREKMVLVSNPNKVIGEFLRWLISHQHVKEKYEKKLENPDLPQQSW